MYGLKAPAGRELVFRHGVVRRCAAGTPLERRPESAGARAAGGRACGAAERAEAEARLDDEGVERVRALSLPTRAWSVMTLATQGANRYRFRQETGGWLLARAEAPQGLRPLGPQRGAVPVHRRRAANQSGPIAAKTLRLVASWIATDLGGAPYVHIPCHDPVSIALTQHAGLEYVTDDRGVPGMARLEMAIRHMVGSAQG